MTKERKGALSGYRVLDLADSNGAYCTKLLADLGADVIKIERPEGDPMRRVPPFAGDVPHLEKSLFFLFRNCNKRGITLSLETSDGRIIFQKLVKTADVLVENAIPGYMASLGLDYAALQRINPGLIMASITEYGQTGPYKDRKGSNLVDCALSGVMIASGMPGKAPCMLPGSPAYDAASMIALIAIEVALYSRGNTGQGHYIDTSVHESSRTGLYPWAMPSYSYALKEGGPPPTPETRLGVSYAPVFPCKDGFIRVIALTPKQWEALVRVLNNPEVLMLPAWKDFMYRMGNAADLYAIMLEYTVQYTMQELFEAGEREGVPIAPIYDVASFIKNPQSKARKFFVKVDHPVAGKALYPGPPYKWTETPPSIRRPAPCLGQHNGEIYCKEMGYTGVELAAFRQAGII